MVIIVMPLLLCALNEMHIKILFFSEACGPASTNFFHKIGDPGPSCWVAQSVKYLPSAQFMILGSWD